MKSFGTSLRNVAAIVACLAVSLMLFTGCDKESDPTPEPDGNGIAEIGKTYVSTTANAEKVYTLTVSKNLLRSSAAATDTYVLLYVDKSGEVKTSTGVVTSSVGEALTLTPAGGTPFTVNVTANGITGIAGNITFTDNSTATGGNLTPFADGEIEITGESVIVNGQEQMQLKDERILGVPGMAINYVYKGTGLLSIKEGKTLIVLPGTTIRFTQAGGGIIIENGATVKMLGEDKLHELDAAGKLSATPGTKSGHITLKGGATKGSWDGVYVKTDKENQLIYVDFINGGKRTDNDAGVLNIVNTAEAVKAGISHCTISGGLLRGLYLSENINLTAFDNNKIENVEEAPVYFQGQLARLAKFDLTSDFTNNAKPYIFVRPLPLYETATLNETSVPYYFANSGIGDMRANLTINAGVTIYMAQSGAISTGSAAADIGELFINGTPEKPVTLTRLPGTSYYWNSVNFSLSSSHKIKNCIIEYSGTWSGGARQAAIATFYDNVHLELENVVVRNSAHYGIYVSNSRNITHTNVTFANNADGNVFFYPNVYNSLDELP